MDNWQKTFWTITAGQFVSQIGSSAVSFALIWWLATESGSPIMMGLSGLVAFIPTALFGTLAGVVADRYNRKIICMCADMCVGIFSVLFAAALLLFDLPVWSVFVVLFCRAFAVTFQQPAFMALTPQYVPKDNLMEANGWAQMVSSSSFILGPVIGAFLYAALPLWTLLLSDLVGALFACTLMGAAAIPAMKRTREADGEETAQKSGFLTEVKQGIDVFRENRALLLIVAIQFVFLIFYIPLSSFYPLMTSSYFRLSAWHASAVEAGFALGMLLASVAFGTVITLKTKHLLVAYLGFLGTGVTCIVCGILPPTFVGWVVFLVSCSCMGAFGMVNGIPTTTYMQTNIAPEKMGRAFSLVAISASVATPIGLLLGGPVAEFFGVNTWFLIAGIAITALSVFGMARNHSLEAKHSTPEEKSRK